MQLTGEALTFDDVSLVPAFSEVLPGDVNLHTRLTREINLNAPLISAASVCSERCCKSTSACHWICSKGFSSVAASVAWRSPLSCCAMMS